MRRFLFGVLCLNLSVNLTWADFCSSKDVVECQKIPVNLTCFGSKVPYSQSSGLLAPWNGFHELQINLDKWSLARSVPRCWNYLRPLLCSVFIPKCENGTLDKVPVQMCKAAQGPCSILQELFTELPEWFHCNSSQIYGKDCRLSSGSRFDFSSSVPSRCSYPLVKADKSESYFSGVEECAMNCSSPVFTFSEYSKVSSSMLFGCLCSLFFSFFALCTFCIEWRSISYPNLIIFYINACVLLVSLGILAQFLGGKEDVVCRGDGSLRVNEPGLGENFSCVIVFILIYYFGSSGVIWFIVLTYSWNLVFVRTVNGQKVPTSQELLSKKSSYFHISAWSVPLILSIGVISMNGVRGNSLTGICFVDDTDPYFFSGFVLSPLLLSSVVSLFFSARGLRALWDVASGASGITNDVALSKIRTTGIKIALYLAINFTGVAVTVIHFMYVQRNSLIWENSLRNSTICNFGSSSESFKLSSKCRLKEKPQIFRIQLQLLSSFFCLISSSFWIFNSNSIESWRRFFRRKCKGTELTASPEEKGVKKHRLITQAFAKRDRLADAGRLSLTFQTSHLDPIGLMDFSEHLSSGDFSSAWAAALPRLIQRRGGCVGASGLGLQQRRASNESYASRSISHRLKRRSSSYGSQLSIPQDDLERLRAIYESAIRPKSSKRKFFERTSSRLRSLSSRLSSRRGSFVSSIDSTSSQILPAVTVGDTSSSTYYRRHNQLKNLPKGPEFLELEERLKNLHTSDTEDDSRLKNRNHTITTVILDEDKKNVSIQTSLQDISKAQQDVGTQCSSNYAFTTDSSSQTDAGSRDHYLIPPLTHIEPNIVHHRNLQSSEEDSSSYDFDWFRKQNGDKENQIDPSPRPLFHNRGRRGAIIETSFKHLKSELDFNRLPPPSPNLVESSSTS